MITLYGSQHILDFEKWKSYFDKDEERRLSFGLKIKNLMLSVDDKNEVHFLIEAPDLNSFVAFINDPNAGNIMEEAGNLETPVMSILQQL